MADGDRGLEVKLTRVEMAYLSTMLREHVYFCHKIGNGPLIDTIVSIGRKCGLNWLDDGAGGYFIPASWCERDPR